MIEGISGNKCLSEMAKQEREINLFIITYCSVRVIVTLHDLLQVYSFSFFSP